MNDEIDIHQLEPARQVLFILNKAGVGLSVTEIDEALTRYYVSPDTPQMQSFLCHSLRDKRKEFIRDGLVIKRGGRYRIMQKGIEYLNRTIMVINPLSGETSQDTVGRMLSGLCGNIKLCDPYFDDTAYQLLKHNLFPGKIKSVKILHSKDFPGSQAEHKIGNAVVEFSRKGKKLHDRFLLDDKNLYFLGASLNKMSAKLSFIFNLTIYKDKFNKIFDDYWALNDS